jgi:hypothetical protein
MELFIVLIRIGLFGVLIGMKQFREVFEMDLFDVLFGIELLGVLI